MRLFRTTQCGGITLIEIIIASAVMATIILAVAQAISSMTHIEREALKRIKKVEKDALVTGSLITLSLGAAAVVNCDTDKLTFSRRDGNPTRYGYDSNDLVDLFVDDNNLVMEQNGEKSTVLGDVKRVQFHCSTISFKNHATGSTFQPLNMGDNLYSLAIHKARTEAISYIVLNLSKNSLSVEDLKVVLVALPDTASASYNGMLKHREITVPLSELTLQPKLYWIPIRATKCITRSNQYIGLALRAAGTTGRSAVLHGVDSAGQFGATYTLKDAGTVATTNSFAPYAVMYSKLSVRMDLEFLDGTISTVALTFLSMPRAN